MYLIIVDLERNCTGWYHELLWSLRAWENLVWVASRFRERVIAAEIWDALGRLDEGFMIYQALDKSFLVLDD